MRSGTVGCRLAARSSSARAIRVTVQARGPGQARKRTTAALVCRAQRAIRLPGRRAAGRDPRQTAVDRVEDLRLVAQAACDEPAVRGDRSQRRAAEVGGASSELRQRESRLPAHAVVEDDLPTRAQARELLGELVATLQLCRRRRRRLARVAADRVHDGGAADSGERRNGEPLELRYVATSTCAWLWSCSPNFARLTNCPMPGFATTSPPSTITFPRSSTVSMSPTTSVPS